MVRLTVSEARHEDVGRQRIRLDDKGRKQLDLGAGDIGQIVGKKTTTAKVWPLYGEEEGIVSMGPLIRQNAGVAIGDHVEVTKADKVAMAKKIVFAPVPNPMRFREDIWELAKNQILDTPVVQGDIISVPGFGAQLYFKAVKVAPHGVVLIKRETKVEFREEPPKDYEAVGLISYEDIGGLGDQVKKIREIIELPLRHPELFQKLGIDAPKGVLLHGPPGTGKTLLAKAVASESDANFFSIQGPEIISKFVGEAEERLRRIFIESEEKAPSIIFIDEIDAIAPKREEVVGEVEKRVVAQLLTLMDGLKSRGRVVVIAATNRPNAVDPALRRPGRFDREIELGVPDKKGRKDILQIHTRNMPLEKDVDLADFAAITHGYVGADIAALAREAAMKTLRRILPEINLEEDDIPIEVLQNLKVTKKDFTDALKEVSPSALREVFVESPNVKWDDIGGLEEAKKELKEAIEWPLKYPEMFRRMGIKPPRGIMLFGPPGTGKTLLAKAVATEAEANFIAVRGPELLSKWVGESEKGIRETFRKARTAAPCIIFFDEIDSIAPRRGGDGGTHVLETMVNQLLTELDGLDELKDVIVVAATNRPDIVDPALLRPGRFDRMIQINAPDQETRLQILKVHTVGVPLEKSVDLKQLAEQTKGYSGADLQAVVREAVMSALRENKQAKIVAQKYVDAALDLVKPSIEEKVVEHYQKFKEEYKGVEFR